MFCAVLHVQLNTCRRGNSCPSSDGRILIIPHEGTRPRSRYLKKVPSANLLGALEIQACLVPKPRKAKEEPGHQKATLGPEAPHEHKESTNLEYPLSWALELECRILMFILHHTILYYTIICHIIL